MSKYCIEKECLPWRPEKVWCVKVDTGLIVTRRNGTVTVTGNTEGYDDPTIQVVSVMRPTKSRSLYAQILGRGTRPIAPPLQETPEERVAAIKASSKPSMLVLDFVGNAGKHKLISAFDILAGNAKPEALDRAKQMTKKAEEDVEEAISRAEKELEEERLEQERKEQAERDRLAELKAKKAAYKSEVVNPFSFWDTLPERIDPSKRMREATDGQIEGLRKSGVEEARLKNLSFTEASVMLSSLADRKMKNLASYRQTKILAKYGLPTDVSFKKASRIMDMLSGKGWKITPEITKFAHTEGE